MMVTTTKLFKCLFPSSFYEKVKKGTIKTQNPKDKTIYHMK